MARVQGIGTPRCRVSRFGQQIKAKQSERCCVQVIRPALLRAGFEKVATENLVVTDDVSIVEQLPAPVKITMGEYTNIKITTPEDMPMAISILQQRRELAAKTSS